MRPDMLLAAGILSDPNRPDHAYRRAAKLLKQGRYREARDLVQPHVHSTSGTLGVQMMEVMARCAMYGATGDWQELLQATLDGYARLGDTLGIARTRRDLGKMLIRTGRFQEADRHLRDAASRFLRLGEPARGAMVQHLRARIRLQAGFIRQALQRLNAAIATLESCDSPRALALARLDRARIHAHLGDSRAAAGDLVAAERTLGSSPNAFDRIRARLAGAECLLLAGEPLRAANGLKRTLIDVVELEEVATRASAHQLLGRALIDFDPASSRRYLIRARHLFASLGYELAIAECDACLARVEHQIGLNARSRLRRAPGRRSLAEWPSLAAQLHVARAEIERDTDPERARQALSGTRAFAMEGGDLSLLRQVDQALRTSGLVEETCVEHPTPVKSLDLKLAMTIPDGTQPQPFDIREPPPHSENRSMSAPRPPSLAPMRS